MKVIEKFNQTDTYLVISGYPEKGRGGKNYGISWYTKETIEPIASKKNTRFVVFAETNNNSDPKLYQKGRILVLRIFDQRKPTLYPRILKWLAVFDKIKLVYVHSEFGANGGAKNFALLIPFLLLIKLTGRKVTYFAHNVVESFDSLAPHLNIQGAFKLKVLNIALKLYNFALGLVVDKIVVLDPAIKARIVKYVPQDKVHATLIPVKEKKYRLSKKETRKKLGIKNNEFVLLYFGFVTWYKGADWLIEQIRSLKAKIGKTKIKLIFAGGPAHSLKDKKYYQKFYQDQLEIASQEEKITITGFVPETKVGQYFTAADLVVFPYRGMIGASGALTYALSYRQPFIISQGLSPILKSADFQEGLAKINLPQKNLTFALKGKSFTKLLRKYQNRKQLAKLKKLSSFIAQKRLYRHWLDNYFNQIYSQELVEKSGLFHHLFKNISFQHAIRQP